MNEDGAARLDDRVDHVVILGLMGAGKTTIGRGVSAALGWPLLDSDAQIELATGRTVRQLRDDLGVAEMHGLEARQLLTALAGDARTVISAAASIIDLAECRARLTAPRVASVWLRVSPALLAARFASGDHRPSYGDTPLEFLARQAAERSELFASVDPIVVDVDGRTADEVLAATLAALESRMVVPALESREGAPAPTRSASP